MSKAKERYTNYWDKLRHGQFTPKGYNYLGPGNVIDEFRPLNEADSAAYQHDRDYGIYEDIGINPKFYWVEEDKTFLEQIQPHKTDQYVEWADWWFKKKKDFYQKNLIYKLDHKGSKHSAHSNFRGI
jgi:hypothetical protein